MDNTNMVLAVNIQKYRKKCLLTQEELAEKLGVTFQAVSKWENAKSAPDISFLPIMADLFGCYIDELFSREIKSEIHYDHYPEFPWHDDNVIRGVVCLGKKILQVTDNMTDRFIFEVIGDAKGVQSECNVAVSGSVYGGCNSGDELVVAGNVNGGCNCGGGIVCGGNFSGDINCGGEITIGGDVEAKEIQGSVVCSNVKCDKIVGDVVCDSVECDKIEGDVTINKKD